MRGKVLKGATQIVNYLLPQWVHEGDVVIDATCGNGNDTLTLAHLIGTNGKVYGFDIQELAIASTEKKLIKNEVVERASLICDSHALMKEHVKEEVDFIIFNLGYLPRADKTITTLVDSTLKAIEAGLDLLKLHGIMVVVIYPGHEEGYEEKNAVLEYVQNLDQQRIDVMKIDFVNQKNNPPIVIALEKKYKQT